MKPRTFDSPEDMRSWAVRCSENIHDTETIMEVQATLSTILADAPPPILKCVLVALADQLTQFFGGQSTNGRS